MIRFLTFATLAALALFTSIAASSATPPQEPRVALPSVADPVGDVPGGAIIDLKAFGIKQSGRGIAYRFVFTGTAPAVSPSLNVCVATGRGLACIVPGGRAVSFRGQNVPAAALRSGNVIRLWVRAAYLGYGTGAIVRGQGRTQLTTTDGTCAAVCNDDTPEAQITYSGQPGCRAVGRKYLNGPRTRKTIALTFDDGPGPYTDDVLNTLKTNHVPATFYMNGVNMSSSHAPLLKRMRAEGHELANHSWAHEQYPGTSSMRRTNQKIVSVAGVRPCTFRPPYGAVNSGVVASAASLNMATIIWDVDTSDWSSPGVSHIVNVGSSGHAGSIVLMHDGPASRPQTAASVQAIINNYRRRGFEFVTVDETLGFTKR